MKPENRIPISEDVAAILDLYDEPVVDRLTEIRALIFETAEKTLGPNEIEETLKWAQPSYVTRKTRTGSTIRIDKTARKQGVSVYFICTSHLVDTFKEIYPDTFCYRDGRAIDFDLETPLPRDELSHCFALALTHHLRKRNGGQLPIRNTG